MSASMMRSNGQLDIIEAIQGLKRLLVHYDLNVSLGSGGPGINKTK